MVVKTPKNNGYKLLRARIVIEKLSDWLKGRFGSPKCYLLKMCTSKFCKSRRESDQFEATIDFKRQNQPPTSGIEWR